MFGSGRSGRSTSQYFSELQPNIFDLDNMMDNLKDDYPTQESQETYMAKIATNISPQVQKEKFQFDTFKVYFKKEAT